MPGPQIIRIKRKREDAPLETLLVDPPKRPRRAATTPAPFYLFKRLAPEEPALAPPAAPEAAYLRDAPGRPARGDTHMPDLGCDVEDDDVGGGEGPVGGVPGVPSVLATRAGDKARDPLALRLGRREQQQQQQQQQPLRQEPVPGAKKKRAWGNGGGKDAAWKRGGGAAGGRESPRRPEVVLTRAAGPAGRLEVVRGPDAMEVDGEEWVLDTFVRDESAQAPPTAVVSADANAAAAAAPAAVPEGTQRVEWLWDGDEWWDDEDAVDSDRVDTDDEDSNAEDYYGADYPEDEDDDFDHSDREGREDDGEDDDGFGIDYRDRYITDYDDHTRAMSYR